MSKEDTMQERIALNPEEQELIPIIVSRVAALANMVNKHNIDYVKMLGDVVFCHKLHCPMRLRDWLNADDVMFLTDAMALYHNFQGTPVYALRSGVKLHFAVSNESRIWVPQNLSHERKFND